MTTVFFDVETGGLDPWRHPLIQFAAVAVDHGWGELATIEFKISFDSAIADQEALDVNGYDADAWRDAEDPRRAVALMAGFFRQHATLERMSKAGQPYKVAQLAAHNAEFDCGFVRAAFQRLSEFCPAAIYEPLDTLALARWVSRKSKSKPVNHKLGSLCDWLGIELDGEAHDALVDVRATVEVARRLSGMLEVSL